MLIDHERTWLLVAPTPRPMRSRAALKGIALGMAIPVLFWWLGTEVLDTVDDLSARPWTLAPVPPPIAAPCIVTPRPVYDWPGEFKSTTVAAVPRPKKGRRNVAAASAQESAKPDLKRMSLIQQKEP